MKKNDRIHSISGESDKVIPIRPGITTSANDDENPASKAAWAAKMAVMGALQILRYLLFAVLLWLRFPVKLVFSIISGLALVGSLLTWLLYEDYSMLPGFVMMGVTAALLAWAYDLLLGLLSPADMVNTL
ncbi:hypothetical protein D6J10_21470 [Salmonella enterica]|uniref:hypothetical protein n=1 Tax=Aeromonas caviae TaxID=648 RepID=UPI00127CBF4B|nr:hypothetical protein [Salmonella enterica]EEV3162703.1 hypothetical protein [Escherichia coli]EHA3615492.1 hypothetical protein [Escherichia coli]EHZ6808562.1 hypothetical protein [Salmonella enterica]